MDNGKRIGYIDTVKGIAIIFVVLQHAGIPVIGNYIMAFHMPLFFLIYGFTLDDAHLANAGSVRAKISAYIVPYFIWALIYCRKFVIENYLRILWGTSPALGPSTVTRVLWFLPAFFVAVVIYRFFMQRAVAEKYKYTVISVEAVVFLVLGKVLEGSRMPGNGLPWSLNISLGGVSWMILGYLIRKPFDFITESDRVKKWRYPIVIAMAVIGGLLMRTYRNNATVSMGLASYGKYHWYIFNGLMQCSLWICIAYIVNNRILRYLGRNTMIIYLTHPIFIAMWKEFGITGLSKAAEAICISLFSIVMGILIGLLVDRFCPVLAGKDGSKIKQKPKVIKCRE